MDELGCKWASYWSLKLPEQQMQDRHSGGAQALGLELKTVLL